MTINQKVPPLEPNIHTECSSSQSASSSDSASDGESYVMEQHEGSTEEVAMAVGRARPTHTSHMRVPPTWCNKSSRASGWARSDRNSVARLRYHLASLRSLLPHSARSAQARNVIADALRYKKLLRREIQMLQKALPYAQQVNVKRLGRGGLQIGVSCKKQPGLLVALMETIESVGLVFANASISCLNGKIRIDAISTEEIGEKIGSLKVALMATIMRFNERGEESGKGV